MKSFIQACLVLLFTIPAIAQEKLPVIAPYNYKNIRELYLDTANHHTALKTILHKDTSALYKDDNTVKRGLVARKLFKEHLLEFREPDYNVFIDFLPDFQIGKSNRDKNLWLNTRGVRIQANIGENFYFESSFFENQGVFPVYLDSFASKRRIIPGQGEIKFNKGLGKAYDFAYVNAMLSYTPNKYLNFTLGYGNNSFGDGYRSLILSDISFSYPYLRMTGTLGKVQYTSMWAQFIDQAGQSFDQAYEGIGYNKKWGVFHFLDWNVSRKLTIGLFDAVIWPDSDSAGRKRGFDWSYMNPVIFLRPAEFSNGSSDNSMLGMNVKYKLLDKTTIYGQLLFDELRIKEFLGNKGWWGNKWATQLGFRSFDLFKVPQLDLQGEFNLARPYTYSYSNTRTNYAHYNQSLAHPMGANFHEILGIASYTFKRWYLRGQITYANYGLDDPATDISYGQDIFKPYTKRAGDYDIHMGQGIKTDFLYGQGTLAFVMNPKYDLRIELSAAGRQQKNILETRREFIFSLGLRSTFRQFYYDF